MRIHCIHHHCSVNSLFPFSRWEYIVSTIIVLCTHCILLQDENTWYPPPLFCELTIPFFKMRIRCIHHHCFLNSLYPSSRWDNIVSTTIDLWTNFTRIQDENTFYLPSLICKLTFPLLQDEITLYPPPLICELTLPLLKMWIHCIHHFCSLDSLYPYSRWEYIVSTIIALWTHCTLLQDENILYPPLLLSELTIPLFKMRIHCIHHYCSLNSLYPSSRWEYILPTNFFCELTVPLFKMRIHCIHHYFSLNSLYPPSRWDYSLSTNIDPWTNFTLIQDKIRFYPPPLFCELTVPSFKMRIHCIHHYCSVNSLFPYSRWEYIVSTIIVLWTHCILFQDENT